MSTRSAAHEMVEVDVLPYNGAMAHRASSFSRDFVPSSVRHLRGPRPSSHLARTVGTGGSSSSRFAPASLFFAVAAGLLVPALGACGDDGTDGTGGSTGTTSGAAGGDASSGGGDGTGGGAGGDDVIVTECGTFDPTPDGAGDSTIPDDPASPAIVAGCEQFCDAFADVCAGGDFLRDDCIDGCRLRACGICAGTLEPLVDCEAAEGDAAACACQDGVPVCDMPDACLELQDETSQCGG